MYSPDIVWAIKSRRLRWEGHVACTGEVHTWFMWGNLREGDHLEDSGVDGRVILKCIIETWNGGGRHGLDRSGSG